MKHEGLFSLKIWVITPKSEGCGFPWWLVNGLLHLLINGGLGFLQASIVHI